MSIDRTSNRSKSRCPCLEDLTQHELCSRADVVQAVPPFNLITTTRKNTTSSTKVHFHEDPQLRMHPATIEGQSAFLDHSHSIFSEAIASEVFSRIVDSRVVSPFRPQFQPFVGAGSRLTTMSICAPLAECLNSGSDTEEEQRRQRVASILAASWEPDLAVALTGVGTTAPWLRAVDLSDTTHPLPDPGVASGSGPGIIARFFSPKPSLLVFTPTEPDMLTWNDICNRMTMTGYRLAEVVRRPGAPVYVLVHCDATGERFAVIGGSEEKKVVAVPSSLEQEAGTKKEKNCERASSSSSS